MFTKTRPFVDIPRLRRKPSNEELVFAFGGGDLMAYAAFYEAMVGLVTHNAVRRCGQERSQDAVRAAFLEAWHGASQFDPSRDSARTWVLTLLHHAMPEPPR